MNGWNYFKLISIIYGLAMLFRGPVINYIPERWQNAENHELDSYRTPLWLWFFVLIGFFLMAYTWYLHFTSDVEHSWILACVLTLTVTDLSRKTYKHECFKNVYFDEYFEDIWRTAVLNVALVLGGAMLLYMGFFIY